MSKCNKGYDVQVSKSRINRSVIEVVVAVVVSAVAVIIIIIIIIIIMLLLLFLVTGLFFLVLLLNQRWSHLSVFKFHTAVLSMLCVKFQV